MDSDAFVKDAPYGIGTVIYTDQQKNIKARIKKVFQMKSHKFRLHDIQYKMVLERLGPDKIFLLGDMDEILDKSIKEIWAELRSYISHDEWNRHRVLITISQQEITHGITTSYFTLADDVEQVIDILLTHLTVFLNRWKTLLLNDSFKLNVQVYSTTHTEMDNGLGSYLHHQDDDEEDEDEEDLDDELVGAAPDKPWIEVNPHWALIANQVTSGKVLGDGEQLAKRCLVFAFILAFFHANNINPDWEKLRKINVGKEADKLCAQRHLLQKYNEIIIRLDLKPPNGPHPLIRTVIKLCDTYECQIIILRFNQGQPVYYMYPGNFDMKRVHLYLYHDGRDWKAKEAHITAVKNLKRFMKLNGLESFCFACHKGRRTRSSPHATCTAATILNIARCESCYRFMWTDGMYKSTNVAYNLQEFCEKKTLRKCASCQIVARSDDCSTKHKSWCFYTILCTTCNRRFKGGSAKKHDCLYKHCPNCHLQILKTEYDEHICLVKGMSIQKKNFPFAFFTFSGSASQLEEYARPVIGVLMIETTKFEFLTLYFGSPGLLGQTILQSDVEEHLYGHEKFPYNLPIRNETKRVPNRYLLRQAYDLPETSLLR